MWLRSVSSLFASGALALCACGAPPASPPETSSDPCAGRTAQADDANLDICAASVTFDPELDLLVFEQTVRGEAGKTTPAPNGSLNGAPVLGYVFPTTLTPEDVGFSATSGIVALALTSHPDFDDTPLWDEDNNRKFDDDGIVFHTHWVVLHEDSRAPAGLAVKQFTPGTDAVTLPPTNPGMPMYMDSPGYSAVLRGNKLRVLVPAQRINRKTEFGFDAVSAFMKVSTDMNTPMLAVHEVYSNLSGNLSLPYQVQSAASLQK